MILIVISVKLLITTVMFYLSVVFKFNKEQFGIALAIPNSLLADN